MKSKTIALVALTGLLVAICMAQTLAVRPVPPPPGPKPVPTPPAPSTPKPTLPPKGPAGPLPYPFPSTVPTVGYGALDPHTPPDGTTPLTPTPSPSPTPTPPSPFAALAVVDGGNAFAADLYARLAAQGKGNLFFSPGSIETVMAMAYAGAAGNTAQQMAQTLHFSLPADKLSLAFADLLGQLNNPPGKDANQPAYQLVVANALWGQRRYGFKPDFILSLRKSYGAGLIEVDFNQTEEARKTINDWVAQQTRDKIRDLIARDALTTLTRLVLTNAVYFKSNWLEKFPKQATASGPFKLSADKSVDVPMMRLTKSLGYSENADLQMLELPYARDQLSMVLFLPRKVEGVADMGKSLSAANIEKWLKGKKDTPVDVTMPRFTFSSDFMLAETLKAMGMTDAFDAGKADFSGMTPMGKLCIAQVIHKAFVAVDEEGTEAAAATAVVMKGNGGSERPEQPKVFKADHPFVFLIRHNPTGEILFLGRLSNPKGE